MTLIRISYNRENSVRLAGIPVVPQTKISDNFHSVKSPLTHPSLSSKVLLYPLSKFLLHIPSSKFPINTKFPLTYPIPESPIILFPCKFLITCSSRTPYSSLPSPPTVPFYLSTELPFARWRGWTLHTYLCSKSLPTLLFVLNKNGMHHRLGEFLHKTNPNLLSCGGYLRPAHALFWEPAQKQIITELTRFV